MRKAKDITPQIPWMREAHKEPALDYLSQKGQTRAILKPTNIEAALEATGETSKRKDGAHMGFPSG